MMNVKPDRAAIAEFAIEQACRIFRITRPMLMGDGRTRQIAHARRAIAVAMLNHGGCTREAVASVLKRDVSTISHLARYTPANAHADWAECMRRHAAAVEAFVAGGRSVPASFWTPQKDAALKSMWAGTMLDREIAAALGCSEKDVPARAIELGIMTNDFPILPSTAPASVG